jgi:hypothetical protein
MPIQVSFCHRGQFLPPLHLTAPFPPRPPSTENRFKAAIAPVGEGPEVPILRVHAGASSSLARFVKSLARLNPALGQSH